MSPPRSFAHTSASSPCFIPGARPSLFTPTFIVSFPAGASFDGRRWVRVPTGTFLLALKVLSPRFRTLVKNAITEAYDHGSLVIPPRIARDRTELDLLPACASKTD